MREIHSLIDAVLPEIVELRHDLHQHPELGYEETRTAAQVLAQLKKIPGIEVRTGVAGTGIVAVLAGDKTGPCVALRADMDALPMAEQGDKPYRSQVEGKMHACGHDGHTSCLVGAARVLGECADELEGPVKFIFQPAEEGGAGGKRMCQEGALTGPDVAAIFGLHGVPDMQVGQIFLRTGVALASADEFVIEVEGVGAHAAFPHHGIDTVYIAAQIVVALQSIVARNTDPLDSVVVTIGQIEAGTASNIIPQTARLVGTVRALSEETRQKTIARVQDIAQHTAAAFGGQAEVVFDENGYPALSNDARARGVAEEIVREALAGQIEPLELETPMMGAEDFAFYSQRVPAFFFGLGLCPKGADSYPMLHQPDFDFNDDALLGGIQVHVEIARRFAKKWQP
jgi:amidohydrolase